MQKQMLIIRGRVQGVFFRVSMQSQARRLGIKGWVRNRGDGAVEACVQGDGPAVEAIAGWCGRGPELARVTCVERMDASGEPDCADFNILG